MYCAEACRIEVYRQSYAIWDRAHVCSAWRHAYKTESLQNVAKRGEKSRKEETCFICGTVQARGAEVNAEFCTWGDSGEQLWLSDVLAWIHTGDGNVHSNTEKKKQPSSLQGELPSFCPFLHDPLPSCPMVSLNPLPPLLLESDIHLGTAATPSSAWNRGGCSHTPRGCVPVPGAVGWRAAQMLPFPNRAACYPLETATYEIVANESHLSLGRGGQDFTLEALWFWWIGQKFNVIKSQIYFNCIFMVCSVIL